MAELLTADEWDQADEWATEQFWLEDQEWILDQEMASAPTALSSRAVRARRRDGEAGYQKVGATRRGPVPGSAKASAHKKAHFGDAA